MYYTTDIRKDLEMDYDYREAMRNDINDAIDEKERWIGKTIKEAYEDVDEAFDQLYDDMWVDDSVTGNASGSYTFNSYKAEEYICHNWDLLVEAIREFGLDGEYEDNALDKGAEYCDITIRCYLLPEILAEVLEERWED